MAKIISVNLKIFSFIRWIVCVRIIEKFQHLLTLVSSKFLIHVPKFILSNIEKFHAKCRQKFSKQFFLNKIFLKIFSMYNFYKIVPLNFGTWCKNFFQTNIKRCWDFVWSRCLLKITRKIKYLNRLNAHKFHKIIKLFKEISRWWQRVYFVFSLF